MKNPATKLSRHWQIFLLVATIAGALLRLLYVEDMEFKEDEHYNFIKTQLIGHTDPWPWVGMPSGAFVPNPGMSIWVFVWLARIAGATDPTELARALQIFSLLGIALLIPFALRFLAKKDQEPWLWAYALAMVNPFAVYYQRKLWPEPFLPFFSMLFLMGWWRRDRRWGAALWGFIGALLGQIHMSGFFFAGGFFLWTALFERKIEEPTAPQTPGQTRGQARWKTWLLASFLGALPLIPWAMHILTQGTGVPAHAQVNNGWREIQQLKFWVFWLSDSLGFHLGNPLGLLRGPSHWDQLSDFIRYPLLAGHATYLNALAHVIILATGIGVLLRLLSGLRHLRWSRLLGTKSPTAFTLSAGLWGFGILLTLTGVVIRRYYMMVSFPLEFVWLAGLLLSAQGRFRWILPLLWAAQLFVSANLVGYVHVNEGSTQGDYGSAFHVIKKNNLKNTGKPWPERPAI